MQIFLIIRLNGYLNISLDNEFFLCIRYIHRTHSKRKNKKNKAKMRIHYIEKKRKSIDQMRSENK